MKKIKLGIIGSTRGTDLQAILDAVESGKLKAKVSVVISNRKNAYILERANNHNVPAIFISHQSKEREVFDQEMSETLQAHAVDLVLLIGFMRILSAKFCAVWQDKLLNVHPSLLPKYAGGMDTNVHQEVLNSGDTETGCTIHFVTGEVDGGPVLVQKKCNISLNETVTSLKNKIQELEGAAFIEAIQLIQNNSYDR
jgi:formyltetrahydrofolate-dependent phosphoribosylglycinamide formyltransferase